MMNGKTNAIGRLAISVVLSLGLLSVLGCERDDDVVVESPVDSGHTPAPAPPAHAASAPDAASDRPAISLLDEIPDEKGAVKADPNLAKVIQTVSVFDHPVGSALSLDHKFLYVTNSSRVLNGYRYGKGSISKLEIKPDGQLELAKAEFVTKIHAPMGIAVSTKATRKFPAGSLFVAVGTTLGVDEKNERIVDIKKFNTGVMIFDPANGNMLGYIPLGTGFAVAKTIGHPSLAPAGVCFDPDGNLYVADCGDTGKEVDPPLTGHPEILRIKVQNIDAYSENRPEGIVAVYPVRHAPMAVYYCPIDDGLYWTTCDGDGAAGGAVYRMFRKEFPISNEVANSLGGDSPLMGVVITPNGGMIASRVDGDLKLMTEKVLAPLVFTRNRVFSSPMNLTLLPLPNGQNILYLPEQQPSGSQECSQRVRVILLPSAL